MEILIVTHKYTNSVGGMQKVCFELHEGISKFYKTHIIAYESNHSKLKFFGTVVNKIKSKLNQNPNINLIYFNDVLMALRCASLKKQFSIRMATTAHGLDVVFPNSIYQSHLIRQLKKLDLIICVSQYTSNQILARGIDSNKVTTILNGTSIFANNTTESRKRLLLQKIGLTSKPKTLLLGTGRAVKRKGFSWFIKDVLPLLNDETFLILTGPMGCAYSSDYLLKKCLPKNINHQLELALAYPSDAREIRKLMNHPKLGKKFMPLGMVSHIDLNTLYHIADMCIMPNIAVQGDAEGFGLVALEAAMRNKVVLASNIEGIRDAIQDGENGVLLPSKQPIQWAETINELTYNQDYRQQLGERARKYTMENFSWEIMVSNYLKAFRALTHEASVHDDIRLVDVVSHYSVA